MLNQHFSSKNFMRLLTKQDIFRYEMGSGTDDYRAALNSVEEAIGKENFSFSEFGKKKMSHGDVITPKNIVDAFAIRKLNDNIKRVFSIKPTDRNSILPQIKILLSEGGEFWLKKYDVAKFFESIPVNKALEIINNDHRLSYESKRALDKLFTSQNLISKSGLPRGISLSSTISEIYMREFDRACRKLDNCYFYTRYVDDILMLFHEDPGNLSLESLLPQGLSFHPEKTLTLHHQQRGPVKTSDGKSSVTYLGYEFNFVTPNKDKATKLEVGIAKKKIKKIKTRIILALTDYCTTRNYLLLKARLTFLASNYNIGRDAARGKLYAGVHFNHLLIDKERHDDLNDIDKFLCQCICSKQGSLGRKLYPLLSMGERRELMRISLMQGYQNKIVRNFKPERLLEIKRIWAHV
ncbi:antiviral reverse transcriptase Drt3a [Pseudomonas putida]|uniref:antiviral reverse transcriptase Drt3a n=1 Tax=Pseudomonas putida TaxID=303 RepID=UPI002B249722|nr:antiviral reverse transcriptase Drt3a [Pseudomonas putida]